jgi:hypothetical protein
MTLDISTPALLFPAISLLFLSYTNRFLHLASLVRQLHRDWIDRQDDCLRAQIDNLRKRLKLIRWMQLLGAISLLLCVASMVAVMTGANSPGWIAFFAALLFMGASLTCLVLEIWYSGGALQILLNRVEGD